MATQVRCPNCGGYKINSKKIRMDPRTGNSIAPKFIKVILYLGLPFLGLFIVVGLLAIISQVFLGGDFSIDIFMFLLGVVGLIFFIASIKALRIYSQTEKLAYILYKFNCILCGYIWDWQMGEKWPEVHVRPDLIAKGEQRIEEERLQRDPRLR
jgi:hypothetical protein